MTGILARVLVRRPLWRRGTASPWRPSFIPAASSPCPTLKQRTRRLENLHKQFYNRLRVRLLYGNSLAELEPAGASLSWIWACLSTYLQVPDFFCHVGEKWTSDFVKKKPFRRGNSQDWHKQCFGSRLFFPDPVWNFFLWGPDRPQIWIQSSTRRKIVYFIFSTQHCPFGQVPPKPKKKIIKIPLVC